MNKKITIILGLIILAFIAFVGARYLNKGGNEEVVNTPVASDYIEGCYVYKLQKDVYTLMIESASGTEVRGMLAYNNYQKDSSSGSFIGTYQEGILRGTYTFYSEGMLSERELVFKKEGNGFIQGFGDVTVEDGREKIKDLANVKYDPKFVFLKNENCTETFVEKNGIFTFEYNPFFKVAEGENVPTNEWKLNSKGKGVLRASVLVPIGYLPGTNFSNARLTIGASNDPEEIRNCKIPDVDAGEQAVNNVKIDSYDFVKIVYSDAALGNRYETISYRGIFDGDCYVIEYTIQSTNLGNYPPEQGIKEFDKEKVIDVMENIIKSFKFTISSD